MPIQLLTADGCAVKMDGRTYAPAKGNILAYSGNKAGTVVLVMNSMLQFGKSYSYTEFRNNENAAFADADAVLAYIQANFKKATRRGDDTGSNKLPSPQIGTITKTDTTFDVPVTNLPAGASIVWVLGGVEQLDTTEVLSRTDLTPSTTYNGTVKFTKDGNIDSNTVAFSVTTDEAAAVPGVVRRWYANTRHNFGENPEDTKWNNILFSASTSANNLTPSLGSGMIGLIATVPFSGSENSLGAPENSLYEDAVINSAWAFQDGGGSTLRVSGVDDSKTYNIRIGSWSSNNNTQQIIASVLGQEDSKLNYHSYGASTDDEFSSDFFLTFLGVTPTGENIDIVFDCSGFFQNKLQALVIEEIGLVTPDPDPEPEPDVEKAAINNLVDVAYWADEGRNASDQLASEGDVIQSIPDAKGNHNVIYNGDLNPDLGRPVKIGKGIDWYNQSETYFSKTVSQRSLPEEVTIVFRHMPGQGWENIQGVFGAIYFGFGGGKDVPETGGGRGVRVLDSNIWVDQTVPLVYLEVSTLHMLVETYNVTGTKATVWYNGVLLGEVTSNTSYRRTSFGIGSFTNCVEHIFFGAFHKFSKFTDQQRIDYLDMVHSFFGQGSLPDKPYASNVQHSINENNHTCNYTYNGVNPENSAAAQYRWYERSGSAFQYTLIGTTKTVVYSESNTLVCSVKVQDNQGNSWRYVSEII